MEQGLDNTVHNINDNELLSEKKVSGTDLKTRKKYEAAQIIETSEMSLSKEIWVKFCENKWCFGCTNCTCR